MIIKSILDTDLYKFTTSYAYMKLFPQARGTFEFIDRDNTEYPEDFIERLYLELGSLGMLHLTKDEQEYMNNNCRFIPPHIGHANVVMGVVNSKLVDKVLVIPAYQNVWKSNSSEFSYRLAMCRMTFSPLAPEVYVNAVEKSMYVPSYSKGIPTYDVLMELKSQMPNNELVIITTPETYSEIPLWHNGSTILKNYKFIMVINGEEPPYGLPDNVSLVYVPTIRMCSTCIRNRVKDGVGIKPFVRDDVYEIIKQYKLYV